MSSQKKKFVFKGKQIFMLGLVALVITAGYYRWTVEQDQIMSAVPTANEVLPTNAENGERQEDENGTEGKNNTDTSGEMSKLRQERDSARSQSSEEWKKVSQSSDVSADAKKQAEKKVLSEAEYADAERSIETQVIAKGYDDCVAYVNDGGVTVTVKGGEIDGSKVAQIKDIIVSETNVPVKNIKINAM